MNNYNSKNISKEFSMLTARIEKIRFDKQYVRTSFIKANNCCKTKEMIAAEIGVYEGINAKYMLLTRTNLKLYLIDAWDNVTVYTGGPVQSKEFGQLAKSAAVFNLCGYDTIFTDKNSIDSVDDFADEFFDYVYIDGDHTYEAALQDMRLWYPKVKTGGVLGGHDVVMQEVSNALYDFTKEKNIPEDKWDKDMFVFEESDWWIYK